MGFKLDTGEFNSTLSTYREYSKRDPDEIVNTKAYFIARRAVVETVKADSGKIKAFFDGTTQRVLGMIINARRGKRGQKGLYGDEMVEAQAAMRAQRLRAVGFIKSGWIWVIKELDSYVKSKRGAARAEQVNTFGKPHGKATPSRSNSFIARAIIRNFAESKESTTPDPLGKFGMPGLQKAVNFETASMQKYVEEKLRQTAKKAGIKTN